MKILVIGGTNFIGPPVVRRLCGMGHEVTVFHRGKSIAELPSDVHHILGESLRHTFGERTHLDEFKNKFKEISPQVVLDMFAYTEQDAQTLMNTFKGIAQRVVAISSMDVYRAYGTTMWCWSVTRWLVLSFPLLPANVQSVGWCSSQPSSRT
jgi:nucleoside-diphosphate-sugar epimerase